jgi:hypothetical protein
MNARAEEGNGRQDSDRGGSWQIADDEIVDTVSDLARKAHELDSVCPFFGRTLRIGWFHWRYRILSTAASISQSLCTTDKHTYARSEFILSAVVRLCWKDGGGVTKTLYSQRRKV